MKRFLSFLLLCSACLAGVQAQHIEYKWYGIYGEVDYAHLINVNSEDTASFNGFTAICGFQFRKEVGVGLGVSYLKDPTDAYSQMPIFIELRSHYLSSRLSPYSAIQVGYSFPLKTTNGGKYAITVKEGGVTFALLAGGRFAITQKFGVNLFAGYQMIMLNKVEHQFLNVPAEEHASLLHNIKFGVGLNF